VRVRDRVRRARGGGRVRDRKKEREKGCTSFIGAQPLV